MLQPLQRSVFMAYRRLHVRQVCVCVCVYVSREGGGSSCLLTSMQLWQNTVCEALWTLLIVTRPCHRDLWPRAIIKLQLSTVANPIPFLLILLMCWYISRGCYSVDTQTQQGAGTNGVCLNNVKDCWERRAQLGFIHVWDWIQIDWIAFLLSLSKKYELNTNRLI